MVRRDGVWGTVCDDGFTETSAKAACYTLGLSGGSYTYRKAVFSITDGDSTDTDPMKIWMDNVACSSTTDNFLDCAHRKDPPRTWEDCNGHWEDVVLFCS